MNLIFVHSRWMILELIRQPAYVVSSVAFPALFYLIFAVPESKGVDASNLLMASFSGFAIFGIVFLQFGVGLAQERSRSWYHYLRTLPLTPGLFLFSRLISVLLFSALAAVVIIVLAMLLTDAHLSIKLWLNFILALFFGSITFGFMGIVLGYFSNEKSSLPMGNLIYLPLSFAGGLWKPPNILPDSLKTISEILPTRHYGEILWASVAGREVASESIFYLIGYSGIFLIFAVWGYSRDKDQRYK